MTRPASRSLGAPLVSAVLLYLFLFAYELAAAAALPWLLELWERSPRLGAHGWLALLSGPAWGIAAAHRLVHRSMDRVDRDGSSPPSRTSLRAGLYGWFVISFASMASALLLLAIFPPPPGEDSLTALLHTATDVRLQAGIHTALWLAVATWLYRVDARD